MIIITPKRFDTAGALVLKHAKANSDLRNISRRVQRTATLDNGYALSDTGYTPSDRSMRIIWNGTEAEFAAVQHLVKHHSRIRISTLDGLFEGAPEGANQQNGEIQLRILILEELA